MSLWTKSEKRQVCRAIEDLLASLNLVKLDRWERLARELRDALLREWDQATRRAIQEALRDLYARQGALTEAELEAIQARMSRILGPAFAGGASQPLWEAHLKAYETSQKEILRARPSFSVTDQRALEVLHRHNLYWVRNYFDRQLGEVVERLGEQVLREGLGRDEAGALFSEALAERFAVYGKRYWDGFANHVVTRSREMGRVEAYVKANVKYLEVRAVLDHRTTEICRHMHGRVIPVRQAVKLRDAILAARTPEEVLKVAPWRKPEEIANRPSSKLPVGMALPPYHFNCRTRTVALSGRKLAAWQRATDLVQGGTERQRELAASMLMHALDDGVLGLPEGARLLLGRTRARVRRYRLALPAGATAGTYWSEGDLVAVMLRRPKLEPPAPRITWDELESSVLDTPEGDLLHELGHVIWARVPEERRRQLYREAARLKPVSQSASLDPEEAVAESFVAWMVARRAMRREFRENELFMREVFRAARLRPRPYGETGRP